MFSVKAGKIPPEMRVNREEVQDLEQVNGSAFCPSIPEAVLMGRGWSTPDRPGLPGLFRAPSPSSVHTTFHSKEEFC